MSADNSLEADDDPYEPYDEPEPDQPRFAGPQLTRAQWDALEAQLNQTPDPDAGSSEDNAHAQLNALLIRLGCHPNGRWETYRLALALVDAGWVEDDG